MLACGSPIDKVILCLCCLALHGMSHVGGHGWLALLRHLLPSEQMEQEILHQKSGVCMPFSLSLKEES